MKIPAAGLHPAGTGMGFHGILGTNEADSLPPRIAKQRMRRPLDFFAWRAVVTPSVYNTVRIQKKQGNFADFMRSNLQCARTVCCRRCAY